MAHWFEDLEPGQTFTSPSREVTAADVAAFAELSGDRNPIHLDPGAARAAGFAGPVAHGALGLAVATGLASGLELTRGTLVALAGLSWRFRAPIHPGDRVALRLTVLSRRETRKHDRGLVSLAAELRNQRGEVVQDGEFVEMVRRRPDAG